MAYKNKEDQAQYGKKHYQDNKEKYIMQNKARRSRVKRFIWKVKTIYPCEECGEIHPACLTFHHKNPDEKINEVSQMLDCSIKTVKKEIRKCIILCFNCHMKLEYNKRP